MKIEYYCPLWGRESQPFEAFCQNVREAGYDGAEMSLPLEERERDLRVSALKKAGLKLIAQHWETAHADFSDHKEEYETRLLNLAAAGPEFISSQTGKDWFSFEQNRELIALAGHVTAKTGVRILHETHRSKFSFAAHVTLPFLKKLPGLRLTLDISHWCSVAESFLEDQEEAVAAALTRTDHIHARVGFPEGPQVPDPFAPEWTQALERHLFWWDTAVNRARNEGREVFTITNEFGPVPYMPIEPYTARPLADQWEINKKMKALLSSRYR